MISLSRVYKEVSCIPKHRCVRWIAILATLAFTSRTRADVTITNADSGALQAAVQQGGTVLLAFDGTVRLTNTIVIAKDTVVDATGHKVTFDGKGSVRPFQVNADSEVTLIHLVVANGYSTNGGGLWNDGGVVHLVNCVFTNNVARGAEGSSGAQLPYGSLVADAAGNPGASGFGGAIYSSGLLSASNTLFIANAAAGGQGGKGGFVTGTTNASGLGISLPSSGGEGGKGGEGFGGAIYAKTGTVQLIACSGRLNTASGGQGGDGGDGAVIGFLGPQGGPGADGGSSQGGCLFNEGAAVEIQSSAFTENTVSGGNGGNGRDELASEATPGQPGGAGGAAQGGSIFNRSNLRLLNVSLNNNRAVGGNGGNGSHAGLSDQVSSPPGGQGGNGGDASGAGIHNEGQLQAAGCTLASNVAVGGNGGDGGQGGDYQQFASFITGIGGSGGAGGSAFGSGLSTSNALVLANCTIVSNRVQGGLGAPGGSGGKVLSFKGNGADGGPGGNGGGVFGGGLYAGLGTVAVTNCTFSLNAALPGSGGPGGPGTAAVAGYQGKNGASGTVGVTRGENLDNAAGAVMWLVNSILAAASGSTNSTGDISDRGHNISSDDSPPFTASGSINNADPRLGALGDYGGETLTLPLLPGSPALDAGDDSNAPNTDQRGVPRPVGLHSDIGAFEFVPGPVFGLAKDGHLRIQLVLSPSASYAVQASTNLTQWTSAGTALSGTDGQIHYDLGIASSPFRFFRFVQP